VVANQPGSPQAGPMGGQRGPHDGHGPEKILKDALDSLVKDGTITQAQADKITSTVQAKATAEHAQRDANQQARRQEFLTVAAKAIGISTTDLETQLQSGTTLADVAKAHNVDPNTVIVALVGDLNAKIDADVASGKLTAEQGTARKAEATQRVTDMVNNGPRHGGPGGRGGMGGRHGGPGGPDGPVMGAPDGPPPADGQAPGGQAPSGQAPTTQQGGN